MPRKPRIGFEGAFYHVITRGNQRQKGTIWGHFFNLDISPANVPEPISRILRVTSCNLIFFFACTEM